ncbi:Phage capsid family protein [compost metagenome]
MPDDTWLFGDFSQIVLGMWGVMDLQVDTATLAASDGLVLRVFQDVDAVVRNKSSFCVGRKKAA